MKQEKESELKNKNFEIIQSEEKEEKNEKMNKLFHDLKNTIKAPTYELLEFQKKRRRRGKEAYFKKWLSISKIWVGIWISKFMNLMCHQTP